MTTMVSDMYDMSTGTAELAIAIDKVMADYEGPGNATANIAASARISSFSIGNTIRFVAYPKY